jgi:PAS domain S-box-containing protein
LTVREAEKAEVKHIITLFRDILHQPQILPDLEKIKEIDPDLPLLVEQFTKLREFSHSLSLGDLQQSLNMKGYCAGALKALQANLRHLTWQTSRVAKGDYSQRVDFMGEFSLAFNSMILRLQEAAEQERKYKLLAENSDDVIWLLDGEMRLKFISPSISKLMNFAPDELEGLPLSDLPLPFLHAALSNEKKTCSLSGETSPDSWTVEIHHHGCAENMIWTETSVVVARDIKEEYVGLLGVTRNISARKVAEGLLQQAYERKLRNDFFNQLLDETTTNDTGVHQLAWQNKIWVPTNFTVYYLDIAIQRSEEDSPGEMQLPGKSQRVDALVDYINRQEGLLAWETPYAGIGLIENRSEFVDKNTEIQSAIGHVDYMAAYLTDHFFCIGIADYSAGWNDFAIRLSHARIAAKIGASVQAQQHVCHYDECGIFQVLAPFAANKEAERYVDRLLGPLLEYDKVHDTRLTDTLEKFLSGMSLKEIAAETFFHHKTIQLRKHRIEQILNISLDSHETRMALLAAIQLRKLFVAGTWGNVHKNF